MLGQKSVVVRGRRVVVVALLACLVATGVTVVALPPSVAAADPAPVQPRTAGVVTADALPTAQINGVAWTQVVIGNTVYVGGNFSSARPAGSPAGQNETPRSNLLAYDLTTGVLISSFAPVMNGQVKALAASPDGRTLYAGGQFTTVNGITRNRIAAFDTADGSLRTSFAAGVSYTVSAIAASADTLYVGGAFDRSGNVVRTRLAAFTAGTGALTSWAPAADATVQSMTLSPDGSKLVLGGMFQALNGVAAKGIGAVDARTGVTIEPWKTNATFFSGGPNAAVLTLSSDGTSIYGGVYKFNSTGALEGTFKIDPNDGTVQWLSDCHGDVYGVWAGPSAVYQVGHSHYCGNQLGWPQPATWNFNRGVAYTKETTGTLTRDAIGGTYASYPGVPAPSLYSWFPRLEPGSFTGKTQAAWTVSGNADYVVLGGEFPQVNGSAQQGLVRFAVHRIAPGDQGPRVTGSSFQPSLTSPAAGTVRVSATANWDRDDRSLTYRIQRSGSPAGTWTTISTPTIESSEWERPAFGAVDTGLTAGATYSYRLQATDPDGNTVTGATVTVAVASAGAPTSYGRTVLDQGASLYWPLDETAGPARDLAGFNQGVPNTGVTRGTAGAVPGNAAMTFSGATGGDLAASGTMPATDVFTAEAWFRTTSTAGGRILGFSDLPTGTSAHRDRQIWMGTTGLLNFGVYGTARSTVTSAKSYNDGVWHQAVASLGPNGMVLSVDGIRVAQRSDVTAGEKYIGTWRIGSDSLSGWSTGSGNFNGAIDEVSIYPSVLTVQQINAQFTASGRTSTLPAAPADSYGAAVFADQPTAFWRLTELTGLVAADSGPFRYPATYQVGTTRGQAGALTGSTNPATLFNGTTGSLASDASFADPKVYSVEAWFKTTSTSGGTLIGFGNSRTGLSTTNDRQVYLRNDGKVAFRTGTGTGAATAVSPNAYNNGAWHHVVATQGAGGMVLYVDGASVAANPSTSAASYTGYWRVGADPTGDSASAYLNATIDEPAVYASVLSPARVAQHFQLARGAAPNQAPTAAVTATTSGLSVAVSGAGSADPDGTIAGYAWNFGDGGTATGVTASHAYTAAGTYTVTLTVTDNAGATGTKTAAVTVTAPPPANTAPTAAATATTSGLSVSVSGSGSVDPDGTIAGYAWNFGDGGTAVGVTASHTYAAAGTYTVTLVVTDNAGATGTTTTSVTVTAPPATPVFADDTFARTTASGWGSAATGGAWTVAGTPTASVGGGSGKLPAAAAQTRTATLGAIAESDVDLRLTVNLDKPAAGGTTQVSAIARRSGSGEYRLTAAFSATAGKVNLQLNRVIGTNISQVAVVTVPGLVYTAGADLNLRLRVVTTGGTTQLQGKGWLAGSVEPDAWTVTGTDAAAPLPAGTVGVQLYVSASATNAPVTLGVKAFNGQRVTP